MRLCKITDGPISNLVAIDRARYCLWSTNTVRESGNRLYALRENEAAHDSNDCNDNAETGSASLGSFIGR